MHTRWVGLLVVSFAFVAGAEAGVPLQPTPVCDASSCACHGTTCGCGQICTPQGCRENQAGFCTNDTHCGGLTCGAFACQNNVCVLVPRDAGRPFPQHPPRIVTLDAAEPELPLSPGYGCTSTPLAAVGWLALVLIQRRRRPGQ